MIHFQKLFLATFLIAFGSPLLAQDCDHKTYATTPTDQFQEHGNGIVTDTTTKLTWMRCSIGMHWKEETCADVPVHYEWKDAERFVKRLNGEGGYAGHSDWRLPTLKELESIVEHRCINPVVNSEIFPVTPPTGFWSSTWDKEHEKGVWLVYFLHGKSYMGNARQEWKLRLVRDAH